MYQGEIHPSQDSAFKQFKSAAYGYRAMFVLLYTYRKKHGLDTLHQMISRYAPPVENHTDNYIKSVCKWAEVEADVPIDTVSEEVMVPVVAAMSRMENGKAAVMADVKAGWDLFRRDFA